MQNTLKKFDMSTYTRRRMKELRGERVYRDDPDQEIIRYTSQRMRELHQSEETQTALDKSHWGCYTVSTMGDRDGET
jgi:hypothetical protein